MSANENLRNAKKAKNRVMIMTEQEFEKIHGKRFAIPNRCGIFCVEDLSAMGESLIVKEVNSGALSTLEAEAINECMFMEESFAPPDLRKGDSVVLTYNGERHSFTEPQAGMIGVVENVAKYDGAWTGVDIAFYDPMEIHITIATHYYGTSFEKVKKYSDK